MKKNVFFIALIIAFWIYPNFNFGQAPFMGTTSDFVLFSSNGAVTNTGISHLTGNVGTNSGSSTGFGNVNGVMHDNDLVSGQCSFDLNLLYNDLNIAVPGFFPASLLGNGDTLVAGTYYIGEPATLNLNLYLDAEGDPNAIFIFQIQGAFSTNANSKVHLIGGAMACNVFWKVEGLIDMATGTTMRGTLVANNAGINMNTNDTLEGRALSTTGAITVDGVLAYTPIGCGSPYLTGPIAPALESIECYTIFSSDGPVTNTGITNVTGDVGTNVGLTTGFDPLLVIGAIHPIPDASTATAAADLLVAYGYLNTLPYDIELLYPPQFGNSLVLTPHTYLMNGAVTFTDTLFLDAQGNTDAVFVIKIYGALSTSTYSKVSLINGTQIENVYWLVSGAVTISDYSEFVGTIVCNNGAINLLQGSFLNGRALTTVGELNTNAITAIMPIGCAIDSPPVITSQPTDQTACLGDSVSFTVIATGTSLSYQWRIGSVDLIDGGNISGATTSTLTINPVSALDAALDYNVIVSGTSLPNDTSINVSLSIGISPVITSQPTDQSVCEGDLASFTVVASGTDLTYQWRIGSVDLIDGGNISGATSATLTIDPVSALDEALDYNVIVSGTCLPNDTSVNVSLSIGISPVITSQPTDQSVCEGDSAIFTVIASGTDLTYQWRIGSVDLIDGGNISGATSDTLIIYPVSALDAAIDYNVIVSGTCLPNDTSVNVTLSIGVSPIITSQPTDQSVCEGDLASFTVVASGTDLTYQWRIGSVDLIDGGNISGATSATLTIDPVSALDEALNYNVIVSGTCLPNDTSINVSLSIGISPVITSQPTDQSVCEGDSAIFTVIASGTDLTYQWRIGSVDLIDGGNISGATSDTLIIHPVSALDAAIDYNVIVSGTCLPNDTSVNVSLTIGTSPVIITQPTDQIVCEGDSVSFTVIATGADLTYQWRIGTVDLIDGGNISGSNSPTLTINPAGISDIATNYNVVVSGGCVSTDTSSVGLDIAGDFGILAGTAITSTGFSEIHDMDVGLSPGVRSSITGFPPAIVVNGAIYASDDVAPPGVAAMLIQAKQALTDAYLYAEGATAPAPQTVAGDQGGKTLTPGIYKSTSTLLIQSGDLTLDAQGDVNAKWIFQIASDFTTIGGAGGNVILTGGAQADNITWQVGSSATIGNYTSFSGNILALTSITMNTGSSIDGRLLARNGAVVLSGDNIINSPSDSVATVISQVISVNVSLMVYPVHLSNNPQTICDGDSYVINGNTYTIAGNYTDTLTSIHGCDSIVVTQLTVNPVYLVNNPQTICDGDSYVINGHTYTIAGNYTDTLTSIHGCDSIVVTQLTVNPVYLVNNPQTICEGESYVFNGHTYTIAGNYTDTLTSIHGCDSIIVTQLTVNPLPVAIANSNSPVCSGSSINLTAQTVVDASYYWTGPSSYTSTDQNPVILYATTNEEGVYSLTVSLNGCNSLISETTVIVYDCEVDLSITKTASNMFPNIGQTVVFTITATNNGPLDATGVEVTDLLQSGFSYVSSTTSVGTYDHLTGIWTIGTMNNQATEVLTITVMVNSSGIYANTATIIGNELDNNTLNNSSTIELTPSDFFIPEGFSPNSDGINDLFVIRGIERYPANTILIFNRWGNKVFESSPYQNNWDGNSSIGVQVGSGRLPTGTYFYILDLGDGSDVYKGTIYLNY